MARASALNAVADAVVSTLNTSGFRALCPGGIYRSQRPVQTPPYCIVGRCSEEPDDNLGVGYGSLVTVPIVVVQVNADAVPDARAADILNAALALVDEPASWSVTGWAVRQVRWTGTQPTTFEGVDGLPIDATVATIVVALRKT